MLLFVLTLLSAPTDVSQLVGKTAPAFTLPRLTEGEVSLKELRGLPVVLVMGTTRDGAPVNREWMLTLEKNYNGRAHVLQVVVLDNPWFVPEFAAKNMIKDFVPQRGHHLVLLEWGTAVGNAYGIPRDDSARVVIIDRRGTVRFTIEGKMNDERLTKVMAAIDKL